jgi:hypothetical protein
MITHTGFTHSRSLLPSEPAFLRLCSQNRLPRTHPRRLALAVTVGSNATSYSSEPTVSLQCGHPVKEQDIPSHPRSNSIRPDGVDESILWEHLSSSLSEPVSEEPADATFPA